MSIGERAERDDREEGNYEEEAETTQGVRTGGTVSESIGHRAHLLPDDRRISNPLSRQPPE